MTINYQELKKKELRLTEARIAYEEKGYKPRYERKNHEVHGLVIAVTMIKGAHSVFLGQYPTYK